ncbi:MAG: hypothetical protein ACOCVZ_06005, partial [Gemmatimonadota bacterium]
MRAPLVVAVLWLALGIAVGLQRPLPPGSGPFLIAFCLLAAAVAGLLAADPTAGPAARPLGALLRRNAPTVVHSCLVGAGLVLGATTRTAAEGSCARWIPDDLPLTVRGSVAAVAPGNGGAPTRLRLQIDRVGIGDEWLACRARLPARWDGPVGSRPGSATASGAASGAASVGGTLAPGAAVVARGRWWSPPGASSLLGRPGALLLDTLRVE